MRKSGDSAACWHESGQMVRSGACHLSRGKYLNLPHHASGLVLHDVALEEKRTHNIRIAEIHAQLHLMVGSACLGPRNLNRVAQRRVIYRTSVNLEHTEMYLVNV